MRDGAATAGLVEDTLYTSADADGTFHRRSLRPFLAEDPDRSAYLFVAEESPIGFGLVSRTTTEPSGSVVPVGYQRG